MAASPLGRPTAPLPPFFLEETEDFLGRPTGLPELLSLSIYIDPTLMAFWFVSYICFLLLFMLFTI
jgi:hypothetical protein